MERRRRAKASGLESASAPRDPDRLRAPEQAPGPGRETEGALRRLKDLSLRPKNSDLATLQGAMGNKALGRFLSRHSEPQSKVSRWGSSAPRVIQTMPDASLQRHVIPEGREGIGEEDDEIVVQRLVQRQPAFGVGAPPRPSPQVWGNGDVSPVLRKGEGDEATGGKAGGAEVEPPGGAKAGKVEPPGGAKGADIKGAPPPAGAKAEDAVAKKEAEKAVDEFSAGGPYRINNFVPDTVDDFGKFDAIYNPSAKLLTADMRVKFTFPDLPIPEMKSIADLPKILEVAAIQTAYVTNFISQVHAGWSGKFKFRNVREPQSVWGKLNPIDVKVNVTSVEADQHYIMKAWIKKAGTANVSSNSDATNPSQVEFFKGDLDSSTQGFTGDKSIGAAEVKRLQRNLPKIHFANGSASLDPKYIPDLRFVADYLKGMNRPKFQIKVVGHASKSGPEASNMKYSEARAQAVTDKLTAFGATNHVIAAAGVGSAGATADGSWRKVDFAVGVDPSFSNVQDTTLHEFGHMLGLDDEYVRGASDKRKNTTQLDEMRKMLGNPDYGKGKEKRLADERTKVDPLASASVMERGNEVRAYHYVTLWQALYNTAAKAAKQPVPALTFADWKLA